MALMLTKSVFIHVPKTGGSWIRKAVKNANMPSYELGPIQPNSPFFRNNTIHAPQTVLHLHHLFTFAFVRNPITFYQSYSVFKMCQRAEINRFFDERFMSDSFEQFVRNVIKGKPGWVSGAYQRFLGRKGELVDFIGRQENLVNDFIKALQLAGEEFDENSIRSTPKANEGLALGTWKLECRYTPELLNMVCEHEKYAMELYGYTADGFIEQQEENIRQLAASGKFS